jgi:uncharacterized protein (DUF4415 family)
MNKQNTSKPAKTDWERLDRMTDAAIDYTDIPPLEDAFFARAHVYISPAKRASYVELDKDVMTWFQQRDGHYPNLINIVLRKYIEIQQEIAG